MKKGDKGSNVKDLQYKLKKVLNRRITVDGDYGNATKQAVWDFQKLYNLYVDGIAGTNTVAVLNRAYKAMHVNNSNLLTFNKNRFVIFVDAGHGGIDDSGEYVTSGKRGYHEGLNLHDGGHYYEGYENRIVAEMFIEELTKNGIMAIRTYHPYKDTSLSSRTELVRSWLKRGYYGYLHSFHSNAISSSNSASKLENTVGYCVYSTKDNNLSDEIAEQHFNNVKASVSDWKFRTQDSDGDSDFEANFQLLRETDLKEFDKFGSILDEWGFHTSGKDCQKIIETRNERVSACLKTAKWVKNKLDN
jgi:N-acetylmuramoyl-L-alanine amidase